MAKGASGSQSSTLVARAPSAGGAAASRAPPTAAGLRKRTTRASTGSGRGGGAGVGGGLNFYTDDSPGIKLKPTVVLWISGGFIAFVALLHVVGKLRGG